jgi:cysteine desulfuration protein SufE
MSEEIKTLTPRLGQIVEDFKICEGQEKLELLLSYADRLQDPPEDFADRYGPMDAVHGCMTPVSIGARQADPGLMFYFDIPRQSPTVRGFASILSEGLQGVEVEDILRLPNDFYLEMGLEAMLTHQRLSGFGAILAHLKRLAVEHAA